MSIKIILLQSGRVTVANLIEQGLIQNLGVAVCLKPTDGLQKPGNSFVETDTDINASSFCPQGRELLHKLCRHYREKGANTSWTKWRKQNVRERQGRAPACQVQRDRIWRRKLIKSFEQVRNTMRFFNSRNDNTEPSLTLPSYPLFLTTTEL